VTGSILRCDRLRHESRSGKDVAEIEHEAGEDILSGEGEPGFENLDGAIGAGDFDDVAERVDQPAKEGTLVEVFTHLGSQVGERVGGGAEFGNEFGTERRVAFLFAGSEGVPACERHPGGFWGANGTVGEAETGGGVKRFAQAARVQPICQTLR
jgi:hypothetical protein